MSNQSDRLKILEKVAAGELSAVDAADLLQAARKAGAAPPPPDPQPAPAAPQAERIEIKEEIVKVKTNGDRPRWMRVRVNDLQTGQARVSVNIPLRLMKFGMKIGSRFAPELQDFDIDELNAMVNEAGDGLLVEVRDEAQGEHVQIYLD